MVDLSEAAPHESPVVLLVDCDGDTRDMYALSLTDSGFAVEEARDGVEAMAQLAQDVPDVIVSELALPGVDGVSLCRAIRRDDRTRGIPVIAVTGCWTPSRLDEAVAAGFDRLILKPCLPADLVSAIRRTIEESREVRARSGDLRGRSAALRSEAREACETTRANRERVTDYWRRLSKP